MQMKLREIVHTSNFVIHVMSPRAVRAQSNLLKTVECLHLMLTALAHATYAQFETVGFLVSAVQGANTL